MDEPTAMLDPRGRVEVMNTVRQINKENGLTVIHITHYMDEALFADRVLVMDRGRVIMEGPPKEVFLERDKLLSLGLDVPALGRLSAMLSSAGVDVRPDALSVEELVDELCRLKSET